uniref:ODAD1 central coiled coil region domain-containing protein n=1 Tax=Ciona savignyi TaxID=51511 RepID=H2Y9Q7_CIOSA
MHKSARSMRSDGSDGDIDGYEVELEKLRRKYRIMEGDRQAYALESQDLIRRQLIEIENLKGERVELMKNLNLAESKLNQEKDKVNMSNLQNLLNDKDDCAREIEEERATQAALDEEIQHWEKMVQEQRKRMGGAETRNVAQTTQKRMSVLEGRLHRALSKFNIALTNNGSLREQIETLRIEKGKFQFQYKKLDKERRDLKREIGQVIEASTLAYDQRDDAHSKIFILKEKAEKDLQLFSAD